MFVYYVLFIVDGNQPTDLQDATVKLISNADCNAQYGCNTDRRQQLCASADGIDACKFKPILYIRCDLEHLIMSFLIIFRMVGDGGPLVVQTKADSTS